MTKKRPDIVEQLRYPALAAREDWPPQSREPAPDMTEQERKELQRYMVAQEHAQQKEITRELKKQERRIEQEAPGWFEIKTEPEPKRDLASVRDMEREQSREGYLFAGA